MAQNAQFNARGTLDDLKQGIAGVFSNIGSAITGKQAQGQGQDGGAAKKKKAGPKRVCVRDVKFGDGKVRKVYKVEGKGNTLYVCYKTKWVKAADLKKRLAKTKPTKSKKPKST